VINTCIKFIKYRGPDFQKDYSYGLGGRLLLASSAFPATLLGEAVEVEGGTLLSLELLEAEALHLHKMSVISLKKSSVYGQSCTYLSHKRWEIAMSHENW